MVSFAPSPTVSNTSAESPTSPNTPTTTTIEELEGDDTDANLDNLSNDGGRRGTIRKRILSAWSTRRSSTVEGDCAVEPRRSSKSSPAKFTSVDANQHDDPDDAYWQEEANKGGIYGRSDTLSSLSQDESIDDSAIFDEGDDDDVDDDDNVSIDNHDGDDSSSNANSSSDELSALNNTNKNNDNIDDENPTFNHEDFILQRTRTGAATSSPTPQTQLRHRIKTVTSRMKEKKEGLKEEVADVIEKKKGTIKQMKGKLGSSNKTSRSISSDPNYESTRNSKRSSSSVSSVTSTTTTRSRIFNMFKLMGRKPSSSVAKDGRSKKDTDDEDRYGPPQPYGNVKIHMKRAHICNRKCNREKGTHFHIDVTKRNYEDNIRSFVAVSFEDSYYQTAPVKSYEPRFAGDMGKQTSASGDATTSDSKQVCFPCYSYQSHLYLDLIDEFSSNLIGSGSIPVFGVIEKKTQFQYRKLGGMRKEMIMTGGRRMELKETLMNMQNPPTEYEWVDVKDSKGNTTGMVYVNVQFHDENIVECFSKRPPNTRDEGVGDERKEKSFKVESLRLVLVRCVTIYKWKQHIYDWRDKILQFHNGRVSLMWLVGLLVGCLTFDAEYLPTYCGAGFVMFMLSNLKKRMSGSSILHLLQDEKSSSINRFVGKLRIAVDSCEELRGVSTWKSKKCDPLVRVWLSNGRGERHYIGRTRSCKDTLNPMFQRAQLESTKGTGSFQKSKQWLLSRKGVSSRDAALHNVTSNWKHRDGSVDWHCLK